MLINKCHIKKRKNGINKKILLKLKKNRDVRPVFRKPGTYAVVAAVAFGCDAMFLNENSRFLVISILLLKWKSN